MEMSHGRIYSERDPVLTGVVAGLLLEHQFCSCWNVLSHAPKLLYFKPIYDSWYIQCDVTGHLQISSVCLSRN